MNSAFAIMVVVVILVGFGLIQPIRICKASGNTIYVDDSGGADYTSIKTAIDSPSTLDGDTIYVYSGNYNENLQINKILTLTGENKENTIISGAIAGNVITIAANYVNISGFTIQNAVGSDMKSIIANGVQNCKITNNIIKSSADGIYLIGCSGNTLSENTIENNNANGIYLLASSNNQIKNNIIQNNNNDGINFYQGSSSNNIYQNTIKGNNRYGIILISSSSNVLYRNDFSENELGNARDQASNTWSYESRGNYWDDYTGEDADHDSIGDTPYIIPGGSNQDPYPLGYFVGETPPPQNQRPVAYIDSASPNPAVYGQEVSFSGHGTDPDGDGTVVGYNWRSSMDGPLSSYSSFDTSSLSLGSHIIYFKVKDTSGDWSDEKTISLTINLDQQKPLAYIDSISPNPAKYGQSIYLVGHGISSGSIASYNWRSSVDGQLGTSSSFSISSLSVGAHTIFFKVKDDNEVWSDEASATVIIMQGSPSSNEPPNADAGGPYLGYANTPISFDGSGSTDDDTISYYKWDFGDGTTMMGDKPTHTYTEIKNYTITLTVTDNEGETDTDTTYANISMQPNNGNSGKSNTPGFEIILFIISVAFVLLWKRIKI